jgi:carboxymethylenebutenolidase
MRWEAVMNTDAGTDLGTVFDAHMSAEFELRDADRAMETMSDAPSLTHVPVITGARGKDALHDFYRDHFVGKWPSDLSVERISRTTSENMVIDEFIVRFTHDVVMDAIVPGIAPTGRRVELPHVAVVGFESGKIAFERIYWDQGGIRAPCSSSSVCSTSTAYHLSDHSRQRRCSTRTIRETS